ncbi:serine protease family S33 [Achlya hypogyna]|uniref:Serine protease family S33 n=1 Tax=Achlya hypogyna TaxID=1202772 RepID=A0A1V9YIU1_ACHHY|nr:serine protease family S33 [Achlya hypogyna]
MASDPIKINGWYPCSTRTFSKPTPARKAPEADISPFAATSFSPESNIWRALLQPFDSTLGQVLPSVATSTAVVECAEFILPLCHSGVCNLNGSIPVFVKRMRASKPSALAKALWFLQGGPGASSVATVESHMTTLYKLLDGSADMYTMDHRGTGRSHRLSCTASQIETSGSPTNGRVTNAALSTCIQDINIQIGGADSTALRSFSTTSAAKDLSAIISSLENPSVFVYGVSYGTYLVERLMQLANPTIKGYLLDGVVAQSGSKEKKFTYFNDWDANVDQVGASNYMCPEPKRSHRFPAHRFVDLCTKDPFCSSKFQLAGRVLWVKV